MKNRWTFLIGVVSLLVALGVGWFAETQYQALVATTELVVPAIEIPPYTIVVPQMFKTRPFPAPMANEPVYRGLNEVAGMITTITLKPDQLVYRDQLVPPRQFRYTDDERLEVISFPIKPEQAVGGQIKTGQHINIYRLVLQTAPNQSVAASPDPKVWLAAPGAGVELLQPDVLVVDVRSTQGSPIAPAPKVQSTTSEATTYNTAETDTSNASRPLTILTIAVPPEIAKDVLRLAGESHVASRYLLWVSLAPIVKSK
ncbi:MAG: SAF domain-containing protein [Chloroflexi bacterium]|nr:SAF domain-containing protein [Chloroflexota bacterium]